MSVIVSVEAVSKIYDGGFKALDEVSLQIQKGEILALLGPNGAGKSTLIGTICGMVTASSGKITIGGHDHIENFREARRLIGLVPQEISLEPFERVMNTVRFSRGLFGLPRDDAKVEAVLRQLSLWDKRDARVMQLSGGMKRRVLIAKALVHEPRILFLDEPSAGVDVELRKEMWRVVEDLRLEGVTIILTTHYIEEAEAIADRIGVISDGRILLVEEKSKLMGRMGHKELIIDLQAPLKALPEELRDSPALALSEDGGQLTFSYDTSAERTGITTLLSQLQAAGITLRDVSTRQSTLEEIFVGLVSDRDTPITEAAR